MPSNRSRGRQLKELPVVRHLLELQNPVIEYKIRTRLFAEPEDSPAVAGARNKIKRIPTVKLINAHRNRRGELITAPERNQTNVYQKWQGPHWSLYTLAEIGYPAGDAALLPMRDQFYDYLFSERHLRFPHSLMIPGQENRFRRCAGQEACAIWYSLKLGLDDGRTDELTRRLIKWQWPDGGWNCDKRPEASISSFHETLIPVRGLALYAEMKNNRKARQTADRAAEVFLKRRLFKRIRDGKTMHPDFVLLKYPHYYHYNILFGLTVMAEAGYIQDPRCADALDLLQSKQLSDGGFPLEKSHFKVADKITTNGSFFDWGPRGKTRSNPFVTIEALHILKAAGRLTL